MRANITYLMIVYISKDMFFLPELVCIYCILYCFVMCRVTVYMHLFVTKFSGLMWSYLVLCAVYANEILLMTIPGFRLFNRQYLINFTTIKLIDNKADYITVLILYI